MLLTVDQLMDLPVKINPPAKIKGVVVDYKKIKVVGVELGKSSLFSKSQVLKFEDLVINENAISITKEQNENAKDIFNDKNRYGEFLNLSVITERKRHLGHLVTFKIDTLNGNITTLWVKTSLALRNLWRQTLVISRDQIVRVTAEGIIVDDNIIKSSIKPAANAELNTAQETAPLGASSEIQLMEQQED